MRWRTILAGALAGMVLGAGTARAWDEIGGYSRSPGGGGGAGVPAPVGPPSSGNPWHSGDPRGPGGFGDHPPDLPPRHHPLAGSPNNPAGPANGGAPRSYTPPPAYHEPPAGPSPSPVGGGGGTAHRPASPPPEVHQYYVTPDGRKLPVPANSQAVDRLRGELTATRFQTWEERQRVFYSPYSTKPAGHYRDPYHERFDYWLWNQPVEIQAQWYYHHHGIMAQERFLAGLAHDPRVKARVADLERQRLALNAAFVPPGLPARELMFNGGFVAAVYQDTKAQANAQWLWTVGQVGMLLSLGVLVVWVAFLFWGSEPKPPEVLDFGPQGVSR